MNTIDFPRVWDPTLLLLVGVASGDFFALKITVKGSIMEYIITSSSFFRVLVHVDYVFHVDSICWLMGQSIFSGQVGRRASNQDRQLLSDLPPSG